MTVTHEKVERKIKEVLERFDIKELAKDEELKTMCQNCEGYCGKDHYYTECKDKKCFKFFIAYFYLKWATFWQ